MTAAEFTRWVDANDWPPPTFWGDAEEKKDDRNRVQKPDKKRVAAFVKTCIEAAKKAGRPPTQSGLEQEAKKANLRGVREDLRGEFHRRQGAAGVEVKRGRIPKSR